MFAKINYYNQLQQTTNDVRLTISEYMPHNLHKT